MKISKKSALMTIFGLCIIGFLYMTWHNKPLTTEIIPIPTDIISPSGTNFLSCDTDTDCALGSVCAESSICPPCLTDDSGKPVGKCECATIKKCEPKN